MNCVRSVRKKGEGAAFLYIEWWERMIVRYEGLVIVSKVKKLNLLIRNGKGDALLMNDD